MVSNITLNRGSVSRSAYPLGPWAFTPIQTIIYHNPLQTIITISDQTLPVKVSALSGFLCAQEIAEEDKNKS